MELLENGLDSFTKGIQFVNNLYNRTLTRYEKKDMIILFHHAIEVLMKYSLISNYGEFMIYKDIDKKCYEFNNGQKLKRGNTISFMEAVHRLYALDGDIKKETLLNGYYYLNEYRNAITHYTINLDDKELEYLMAKLVPELYTVFGKYIAFFNEYVKENELYIRPEKYEIDDAWFWTEIANIGKCYFEAVDRIDNQLCSKDYGDAHEQRKYIKDKNYIDYDICPVCGKKTFLSKGHVIEEGGIGLFWGECALCKFELTHSRAYLIALSEQICRSDNLRDIIFNLVQFNYLDEYNFISSSLSEDTKRIMRQLYNLNRLRHIDTFKEAFTDMIVESMEENNEERVQIDKSTHVIKHLNQGEIDLISTELDRYRVFMKDDLLECIEEKYIIGYSENYILEYTLEKERLGLAKYN